MIQPIAPAAVRWITHTLENAGHETWTVGGAVRDACLGRPSGDWDFATHARPQQVRRLFRRTVPIGIQHGTVGVLADDGTLYEVTTFRRDVETDGRHAVVAFAESLEEDLARRDFTINAIAWHPERGEVCDPFDGRGDLERGLLRTVGDPAERFAEDYLRVLRALRFAGQFALEIEDATWSSIRGLVDRLTTLSAERVREELLKVLAAGPEPLRSLELYATSGALGVLYPELEALRSRTPVDTILEVTEWSLAVASAAQLPRGRPLLRLAALLRAVAPDDAVALLLRLRMSNANTDYVARLAEADPIPEADAGDASLRRWLSSHGVEHLSAIVRVQLVRAKAEAAAGLANRTRAVIAAWARAREVRSVAPPLTVGELAIDGRGLISCGLKPGPDFGRILDDLLEWVLEDPSRNEAARLEERVGEMLGVDSGG